MSDWIGISLLYLVGTIIVIAEIFVPAGGLMAVVGVLVLGFALFETFLISSMAGLIGLVAIIVLLPTGTIIAVKNWHKTPVGRRLSPPNPVLTVQDRLPVNELETLVGKVGRALTTLRPVGTCEFDGRRVECTSEYGMIARGAKVEAVRLVDRTVSVRKVPDDKTGQV